jgi:acetyl esterase/lipase
MTRPQRDALDALLRAAPRDPDLSPEAQRRGFALALTRPAPADVTVRRTLLGGRPALELVPSGAAEAAGAAGRARLLYLHGGGYVIGSPETHEGLVGELARRAGVRATSLDYRLAPGHPFPAAVQDGLAAYRALLDGGTHPNEIALAGDSAGGGLAIATLLAARDAGLPQPAAVAVLSPWVDLTLGGESIRTKEQLDPIFTAGQVRAYADLYLGDQDRSQPLASPVFGDLAGLPPLHVQVGSHELLLDDATRLAARAGSADVDVTLEVWPEVPHVFQYQYGRLDEADVALDRTARFLAERLGVAGYAQVP